MRSKLKKVTVITTLFVFFLCSTFSFCYATNSQTPGNPSQGILISKEDKKETKEKIEKEIRESEKELKKLSHKKKS
jgi:hypothetical protein